MPTYDYECLKCGHRFEEFQRITDAPRQRCPECRGRVQRIISGGSGLLFKGSGFYITDYRSESYKKAARQDKPPSSGNTSKPSTSAASAPAATSAKSS